MCQKHPEPLPQPIEFKPGCLYPLSWLEQKLEGVMSLKTFLDNLGLECTGRNRRFQYAVTGDEVLQAMSSAMTSEEKGKPLYHLPQQRKRGRPKKYV